jgi:hypothetical protein
MRATALGSVVLTCLAAGPASAAAEWADWKEYVFVEHQIAKEFPAPPVKTTGTYKTEVIGDKPAPTTIYTVERDNLIFRMTVVDLMAPELVAKGASIYGECVFLAQDEGEPLAHMPQRVEDGTAYRVYGHLQTVELFNKAGRKQTNCFYSKGRLFKIESHVLPAHGQMNTSMAIRFSTSIRFRLDQDFEAERLRAETRAEELRQRSGRPAQ